MEVYSVNISEVALADMESIYNYIAKLIAVILKPSLPCKLAAKLGYLRCVIRAVRN